MALRRAFDVSAPTAEERWDVEAVEPPPPPKTLADRVKAKAAEIAPVAAPEPAPEPPTACDDEDASPMGLGFCTLPPGHKDAHRNGDGTWPR